MRRADVARLTLAVWYSVGQRDLGRGRQSEDQGMRRRGETWPDAWAKAGLAAAGAMMALGLGQSTPAWAQSPPSAPQTQAARPAGAGTIGVPHTLAEALAATYAYQPALQAERAKLRATDENVPTALAGWRPTVIMAAVSAMAMASPAPIARRRQLGQIARGPPTGAGIGDGYPADLYRRKSAGQRQPRQEPGHGGTRQPDRAGAKASRIRSTPTWA